MTRILTIIALLFATPAWAGEVDGTSFLCKGESVAPWYRYVAVNFSDGLAEIYRADYFRLKKKYSAFNRFVSWKTQHKYVVAWNNDFSFQLNRKTLVLSYDDLGMQQVYGSFNCKFMSFQKARKVIDDYEYSYFNLQENQF